MNVDWWTYGNQILVFLLAQQPIDFADFLEVEDIANLSRTSRSRHCDCKILLKLKEEEELGSKVDDSNGY